MKKFTQYLCFIILMTTLAVGSLKAQFNQSQAIQTDIRYDSPIAISDSYALIGDPNNDFAGAVFVYAKQGDGSWKLDQKLVAGNRHLGASFGHSVAISGDYIVVGAPNHNYTPELSNNSGAVFVFHREGGKWVQKNQLESQRTEGKLARFGVSVAISGGNLVVGEERRILVNSYGDEYATGMAYLFSLEAGTWRQKQLLLPTSSDWREIREYYAHSLAIQGGTVLVGAWGKGAYVFRLTGSTWEYQASLKVNEPFIAWSIALDGDYALLGSHQTNDSPTGFAYVFKYDGSKWNEHQKLEANDRERSGRGRAAIVTFGYSVAMANGYALIGARLDIKDASGAPRLDGGSGAAYLFRLDGSTWRQEQKLIPNAANIHSFGYQVALANQTLFITGNTPSIKAHLFTKPNYPSLPCSITKVRLFPRTDCSACVGRTVGGQIQVSTVGTAGPWTTIFIIPSETPNAWNEFAIPSSPTGYKAVRYVAPYESYGNLAEVEFYITGGAKLSGTPFGDGGGSWHGLADRTFEKALDGDVSTYYDATTASGAYVGLETTCERYVNYRQGAEAASWSAEVVEDRLVVGPNPSPDAFELQLWLKEAGAVKLEVVNGQGQVVEQRQAQGQVGENRLKLELGDQAAGLYVLRVSQASGRPPLTAKLIKTGR